VNQATMMRRLALVVLVAGALFVPTTAATAQVPTAAALPPGIGVKLLQVPTALVKDPRAQEYIVDHLSPGTTISRQIGFSNGDAHPVELSFYPVAATITGGLFIPGAGHSANELSSWMTFSPTSATVEPGKVLPVTLRIAVPADATSGERYAAALAAETTSPAAGGGITSVSRVGIRLYLSVGPGGTPTTAFHVGSMSAQRDAQGDPLVSAQVQNTGGRAVDLSGRLELTDGPSLLTAGPFPASTVDTMAPGQSGTVSFVLAPSLPDGPWDARVTLISGLNSASATSRLMFPSAEGGGAGATQRPNAPPPLPYTASHPSGSDRWPEVIGAIAAGAVILLGLIWFIRRRRASSDRDRLVDA
jgi:hypothetical protein